MQGSLGLSRDCSPILAAATVAKLGTGPSCQFRLSSALTITLGSGATILPAGTANPDVISLAPDVVGSATGAPIVPPPPPPLAFAKKVYSS